MFTFSMYEMIDEPFAEFSDGRRNIIIKAFREGIRAGLLECVNTKGIASHGRGENPSHDKEIGELLCGRG